MSPLHVQRHPLGPRLYVGGFRLHHGASGCALAALALCARRPRLALAGLLVAAHDLHDRAAWFRVERMVAASAAVLPPANPESYR